MIHPWLLWLLYFAGQAISILGRASASASSQFTPWNSVREYTKWHWPALIFRLFAATMGFLLWWSNGAFFEALMSNQLGVNIGIQRSIPLTPATAGIYGLLSDVLLDWVCAKVPFLKGRIPNGSGNSPSATT
ncbi:MAG: hypothetical protein WA188_11920 [Terriglobales bacterium]